MIRLVSDANFHGQTRRLISIMQSPKWIELWNVLNLSVADFDDLGLPGDAKDRTIWNACQAAGCLLITGNRNHDGEESLNAAILSGAEDSLPVITIGDGVRVMRDAGYANQIVNELMELLIDLADYPERVLGSGRIYLPKKAT